MCHGGHFGFSILIKMLKGGNVQIVQIVNDTDFEVNLQSDYIIGSAMEVDTILTTD